MTECVGRTLRVFRVATRADSQMVEPIDSSDYEAIYGLAGEPVSKHWRPVEVRVTNSLSRHPSMGDDDLLWLGPHSIVMRDRALEVLSVGLDGFGEFLELVNVSSGEPLWLFNAYRRAALKSDASKVVLNDCGQVAAIKQHVFDVDAVMGVGAFRIPEVPHLFLSQDVVGASFENGLSGLSFPLVWDAIPLSSD